MNGFFHSFPFAKGNFLRDYFNPSLEKRLSMTLVKSLFIFYAAWRILCRAMFAKW